MSLKHYKNGMTIFQDTDTHIYAEIEMRTYSLKAKKKKNF